MEFSTLMASNGSIAHVMLVAELFVTYLVSRFVAHLASMGG